MIPNWYVFLLLALISFRTWRLIAEDDILQRPRHWLVRLPRDWEDGDEVPEQYRDKLGLFLTCPWCAGAWVSGLVYLAYLETLGEWPSSGHEIAVGFGVWFALSASVGLIRGNLDEPESA